MMRKSPNVSGLAVVMEYTLERSVFERSKRSGRATRKSFTKGGTGDHVNTKLTRKSDMSSTMIHLPHCARSQTCPASLSKS
jgi:hypothetical protein